MRERSTVYVAGTFNRFHRGHEVLIDAALDESATLTRFGVPTEMMVCVLEDAPARLARSVPVRPFAERLADVQAYVASGIMDSSELEGACSQGMLMVSFMPIPDAGWTDPELQDDDVIVCSRETEPKVRAMLASRPDRGRFIGVRVVPMMRDETGREIHSTLLAMILDCKR